MLICNMFTMLTIFEKNVLKQEINFGGKACIPLLIIVHRFYSLLSKCRIISFPENSFYISQSPIISLLKFNLILLFFCLYNLM